VTCTSPVRPCSLGLADEVAPAGKWGQVDSNLVAQAQKDADNTTPINADDFTNAVLLGMTVPELQQLVMSLDHPKYRGSQIFVNVLNGVKSVNSLEQVCAYLGLCTHVMSAEAA
jgi:hypothetical protein